MEKKAEKLAHKIITQYNSNSDSKPGTPPDRCPFCEIEILNPAIRKQHIGSHEIEKLQRALSERELSLSEAKGRILDLEKVGNDLVKHLEIVLGDIKLSGTYHLKERLKKILETAKPGDGNNENV